MYLSSQDFVDEKNDHEQVQSVAVRKTDAEWLIQSIFG